MAVESGPTESVGAAHGPPARIPRWFWVAPFFMSAFLFLSGLFAFFSPIPILLLHLGSGGKTQPVTNSDSSGELLEEQAKRFQIRDWKWGRSGAWLAGLTNLIVVALIGGKSLAAFYAVFVLGLALSLPEFLRRRFSLEKTVFLSLFCTLGVGVAVVSLYAQRHHVTPWVEAKNQVTNWVDVIDRTLTDEARNNLVGSDSSEEFKQNFVPELPSVMAVSALILAWLNLMFVLRVNPGRLREYLGIEPNYFQTWKAPEILLWPTVLSGFLMLWDLGWPTDVALNLFKFLIVIYMIHGLSILSGLFTQWKIQGIVRTAGYLIAVFLMWPLLLLLVYIDQWFDIRAKLGQS